MLILRDLTSHSVVVPYRNRVHDRGLVNTQCSLGRSDPERLSEIKRLGRPVQWSKVSITFRPLGYFTTPVFHELGTGLEV